MGVSGAITGLHFRAELGDEAQLGVNNEGVIRRLPPFGTHGSSVGIHSIQ